MNNAGARLCASARLCRGSHVCVCVGVQLGLLIHAPDNVVALKPLSINRWVSVKRRNSVANAFELRPSCSNPSISDKT